MATAIVRRCYSLIKKESKINGLLRKGVGKKAVAYQIGKGPGKKPLGTSEREVCGAVYKRWEKTSFGKALVRAKKVSSKQ